MMLAISFLSIISLVYQTRLKRYRYCLCTCSCVVDVEGHHPEVMGVHRLWANDRKVVLRTGMATFRFHLS